MAWLEVNSGAISDFAAILGGILLLIPLNDLRNQKKYYNKLRVQQTEQNQSQLKKLQARIQQLEESVFSINGWAVLPAGFLMIVALIMLAIKSF